VGDFGHQLDGVSGLREQCEAWQGCVVQDAWLLTFASAESIGE
jgi:hypothetical protein